jgi:malyl-CoA/(S)-citramalyl-CoA lyase
MIHFFPPHIAKIRARLVETARQVDVLCGNLEDAIPVDAKEAARAGFIEVAQKADLGDAALWTRVNALNSPWFLDDMLQIVGGVGNRLDVVMIPKVEGPWDIHFVDQLLAQLEARHRITKPILLHALLETAQGVRNVEDIAAASPRMHGMSLGPADLAASRGMKTTRVGGGHPSYGVLADAADGGGERAFFQQDLWHYTISRMVDACLSCGIRAFYGPFGDFQDEAACEAQFRNAFLMGCTGAWTLHPSQIAIARRVFSPDVKEVLFARRILEAMPDGSGAVMIDGKMQDDATWKQAPLRYGLPGSPRSGEPEPRRSASVSGVQPVPRPDPGVPMSISRSKAARRAGRRSPSCGPGDRVLLCTKGLTGVVGGSRLLDCVRVQADAQRCADALGQLALDSGSRDNVSCLVSAAR